MMIPDQLANQGNIIMKVDENSYFDAQEALSLIDIWSTLLSLWFTKNI